MLRIALVVLAVAAFPLTVFAGPKEDAQAVADKFIAAFIAGDLEATTVLFAPNASFWGTVSPELGTTPDITEEILCRQLCGTRQSPTERREYH